MSFGQTVEEQTILNPQSNPGMMITPILRPPSEMQGSVFLFDDFVLGGFSTRTGLKSIAEYQINFDLFNNQLEVSFDDGIKVCPMYLLSSFSLKNSDEVYYALELVQGYQLEGIGQMLYDGDLLKIFIRYSINIQEPTYVPALDMGDKNSKVMKKKDIIVLRDGKVIDFSKRLSKNRDFFSKHYQSVKKFVKEKNLDLDNRADIVSLFAFYEGLK